MSLYKSKVLVSVWNLNASKLCNISSVRLEKSWLPALSIGKCEIRVPLGLCISCSWSRAAVCSELFPAVLGCSKGPLALAVHLTWKSHAPEAENKTG